MLVCELDSGLTTFKISLLSIFSLWSNDRIQYIVLSNNQAEKVMTLCCAVLLKVSSPVELYWNWLICSLALLCQHRSFCWQCFVSGFHLVGGWVKKIPQQAHCVGFYLLLWNQKHLQQQEERAVQIFTHWWFAISVQSMYHQQLSCLKSMFLSVNDG